jgi:microcystin-dependent protein
MANQPETATWEAGVYQLETTDPVEGGLGGVSNEPIRQLGNRTKYLKDQIERIEGYGFKFKDVVEHTSGSLVLNQNDVGKLYTLDSTTVTIGGNKITLPDSDDIEDGTHIGVLFIKELSFLVQPAAGDTIVGGNKTFANAGDFTIFVSKGNKWYKISDIDRNNEVPAGTVVAFAANSVPTGYLRCDGSNAHRPTYAKLFAAIGTTFGAGDGSTTFGLPDLRGEFIRGWDNGRGVDTGRVFGSAQTDELKSHLHTTAAKFSGSSNTYPSTGGNVIGSNLATGSTVGELVNPHTITTTSGGVETRPRNVALLYLIKF